MILETERLVLRPWREEDAVALFELAKDPRVGPACGWKPHESAEESRTVLDRILINDFTYAVELRATGELVGNISLMPPGESAYAREPGQAEIGFWLGHDYWGNGYMPEACRELIRFGFEEGQLREILCCHSRDNRNSAKAQEKSGFTFLFSDTGAADTKIVNHLAREDWLKAREG